MTLIGEGGSKDIRAATLAQFQAAPQIGHGQREVTDGDIGLADAGKGRTQLTLVQRRDGIDLEDPSPGDPPYRAGNSYHWR